MSFSENTRVGEILSSLPNLPEGRTPLMLQALIAMCLLIQFNQAMKAAKWPEEKRCETLDIFKSFIANLSPELVASKEFSAARKSLIADIQDIKDGRISL